MQRMRTNHLVSSLLLLTSLTLLGAGCGQGTSVSTNGEPTSKPSTTTSDSCNNPYYGFKSGLSIAFSVTPFKKIAGDSDYTTTILARSGNTVTARTEIVGGITTTMKIDCVNHSVVSTDGQDFKMNVVSSSGTFMPPNVKPGSTWSNTQTASLESSSEEAKAVGMSTFLITTTEDARAVAEESITIKAGTYKAIKVELTQTSTSQFEGAKKTTTTPSTYTSTEWWVKGIGMVKSVTKSQSGTTTNEAKSITGA